MIALLFLYAASAFAQTSYSPIIDNSKLNNEAMARTVFIRAFQSADTENPIKSTGVILKDGYLITNEHVLRAHMEGKKVAFHIYTNGKTSFHKFEELSVLGCDKENDVCLLKTDKFYKDSFFSLESPSFRTISSEKPIGLYKDETIFFNGFCGALPEMKKAKYVDFKNSAYENVNLANTTHKTTAIHFAGENNQAIACGGDSGGPLFDANLYLYGIVRATIIDQEKGKRNFAVPVNIIRDFVNKTKGAQPISKLTTIVSFSELDKIFPTK